MAGVSTKAIKTRIKSMASTRQITKAMELVAASKLRSAQQRAVSSRPFFEELYQAMNEIADSSPSFASDYLTGNRKGRPVYIVVAGDRGLAGGYNNNVLRLAYSQMEGKDALVLPIGKKSVEFWKHRGAQILSEDYLIAADVSIGDCYTAARVLCDGFLSGKFSEINLVYTNFASVLEQTPATLPMLPMRISGEKRPDKRQIIYETGSGAVFDAIVPEYFGGVLYGAMCESNASEQAARRTAMDAATKNADEIIEDLNLRYNRARQGAITQEITEIVAGSNT